MGTLVGDVMDKDGATDAWQCIVRKLEGVKERLPWVHGPARLRRARARVARARHERHARHRAT